ncbi:MAG: 50S ribosomal protein L30 [SAR324 cluster bacterium]|nr:50S ribosomal protein L30 [SAR324 cluster bacterium]
MAKTKQKTLRVKLVKSPIGTPKPQRETLRGLGLTRMQRERELPDTPEVRGMVFKVIHLVQVDPPTPPKTKV